MKYFLKYTLYTLSDVDIIICTLVSYSMAYVIKITKHPVKIQNKQNHVLTHQWCVRLVHKIKIKNNIECTHDIVYLCTKCIVFNIYIIYIYLYIEVIVWKLAIV